MEFDRSRAIDGQNCGRWPSQRRNSLLCLNQGTPLHSSSVASAPIFSHAGAGTAHARMRPQRSSAASGKGRGMPPVSACQRSSAINRRPRSPFARGDGDLPLLKAFERANILARSRPNLANVG
jgi:hypothetical protein